MPRALLVVDAQNDFYEEGALPVPGASEINPEVNKLLKSGKFDLIVASQDWHPENHLSFAKNHGKEPYTPFSNERGIGPLLWPVHCQQGTTGAEFHPEIQSRYFNLIIRKGTNPEVDSYSAFTENDGTDLGLAAFFKGLGINSIDVCGLALDYCVKFTALDAVKHGFTTNLILAATRGVNAQPGDVDRALAEMKNAGVRIIE